MSAVRCPPERELERLLEEDLGALERGGLEQHVESCAQCQAKLHALVTSAALGVDTRWSRAAHSNATSSEEIATFLRRLGRATANSASSLSGNPRDRGLETHVPRIAGYEIQAEIGRGAVGIVYRARHVELDRLVALKVILAGPYSSPRARRRFRAESQAIARLRHPRIVQVYEIGEQDGCLYLTLELVEGGNLAATIAEGPLPAAKAARIVAELAEAIEHAHAHGVIHRDLKPANVLFDDPARGAVATTRTERELPCELKITDFGLAKVAYEDGTDEHELTQSGEFLGTPSYTAPEQARGDAKLVGPAADVYSLGAILYELVTGRPPFQAASVVETLMQVAHHDAVPPALLVPGLPRDLDTICTRCLAKDPAKRFESAAALAADLRRFMNGEPILARRVGRFERAVRWMRRRPARAMSFAGGTIAALAFVATITWTEVQAAALERDVDAHLSEVSRRADAAEWSAARTALERAKTRSDAGGRAHVRESVASVDRELDLVARLDAIRLERSAISEGRYDERGNAKRADRAYETAFAAAGIDALHDEPGIVSQRIATSRIRRALVAALDDWALRCVPRDDARRARLMELARLADSESNAWLDRVRTPSVWRDPAALEELARTSSDAQPTVEMQVAIGQAMYDAGLDSIPFLERVQQEHPDDFWANLALADALYWKGAPESVRYCQAALALRPQAAVVHNNLGTALAKAGSTLPALAHFRRAITIDPSFAQAHTNYGNALGLEGRLEDAVFECKLGAALAPEAASAHSNLARALMAVNRVDEAIAALEEAICVEPNFALAHANLCSALHTAGRLDESIEHGEIAVELSPRLVAGLCNLGLAYRAKGRVADAARCFGDAAAADPTDALTRGYLAETLRDRGRLDEALAAADEGVRIDPACEPCHSARAKTLAMRGRVPEAIESFEAAVALAPFEARVHHNLAIALHAQQRTGEAIAHYTRAIELDPEFTSAYLTLAQAHAKLRQWKQGLEAVQGYLAIAEPKDRWRPNATQIASLCERMLEAGPRFDAIVAGSAEPEHAHEALDVARLCVILSETRNAARLYAEAFESEPDLARDPRSNDGFEGACCAMLVDVELGKQGEPVEGSERLVWRERALAWMTASLEARVAAAATDSEELRARTAKNLVGWVGSASLASVRDAKALEVLPEIERESWRAFWVEVRALLERVSRGR